MKKKWIGKNPWITAIIWNLLKPSSLPHVSEIYAHENQTKKHFWMQQSCYITISNTGKFVKDTIINAHMSASHTWKQTRKESMDVANSFFSLNLSVFFFFKISFFFNSHNYFIWNMRYDINIQKQVSIKALKKIF